MTSSWHTVCPAACVVLDVFELEVRLLRPAGSASFVARATRIEAVLGC